MTVAVCAVQGAFIEHEKILASLGVSCIELRQKADLNKNYDAIILPGGESTVQGKLLKDFEMFDIIQNQIKDGIPVLATCAGLILLSAVISNDTNSYFKTLPVTVKRNAYGRQLGSFFTNAKIASFEQFPMKFIRAPVIESVSPEVEILGKANNQIVGVRYKNQIALTFHPELTDDFRLHELFLSTKNI